MMKFYIVSYCGMYDTEEEALEKAKELAKEVGGVFEVETRTKNTILERGLFVTATEVHDFRNGVKND